jgi:hypothetical protein
VYVCSSDPPKDDWVDHKESSCRDNMLCGVTFQTQGTKIKFIACSLMLVALGNKTSPGQAFP